jgi:hypothetical protein
MPLEQALKSSLRDRVSTANNSNVDDVADQVNAALTTLDPDDKDYAAAGVAGGSVHGQGRRGTGKF